MSKIPAPPKRNYKNRISTQQAQEVSSNSVSGSGYNVAKSLQDTAFDFDVAAARPPRNMAPKNLHAKPSSDHRQISEPQTEPEFIPSLHDILDDAPDVVIGEEVEIKGDFQFDGLLHLKGRFEGRLLSEGDIYVGPKAVLKSNLQNINRLIIDGGHVIGRISVQQLGIAGPAYVKGDISCKYLEVNSDECTILGKVYIHPNAPEIVEFPRERLQRNEEVSDIPEPRPVKKVSPPSPSKETMEVSIQAADPDEILTPAELALRAKLEAKERRKEAKRLQQEESLRQSHGLAPLSPESTKATEMTSSRSGSPAHTTTVSALSPSHSTTVSPEKKSLGDTAGPALFPSSSSPEKSTPVEDNEGSNENQEVAAETENIENTEKDSPIKLVSDAIGEPENAQEFAPLSVPSSPTKLTADHPAEDSLAVDDINSPQKAAHKVDGDTTTQDTADGMARLMMPPSPEQRAEQLQTEEEAEKAVASANASKQNSPSKPDVASPVKQEIETANNEQDDAVTSATNVGEKQNDDQPAVAETGDAGSTETVETNQQPVAEGSEVATD